jgi:hypothetical protein
MVANGQASLLKVYYETFLKGYVIRNRETLTKINNLGSIMLHPDTVMEEANKMGEYMLLTAVDDKTEYLHVILVGGNDQGSEAQMKNLVNLIQLHKLNNKHFKLVTIQYMSKDNNELK